MGGSASKAARGGAAAAAGAARRQYPQRPNLGQGQEGKTGGGGNVTGTEGTGPVRRNMEEGTPGPTVHPSPSASGKRNDGMLASLNKWQALRSVLAPL